MTSRLKTLTLLFLLAAALTATAQEQPNLGLIPTPQHVETGLWKTDSVDSRRLKVKEIAVDNQEIDIKKSSRLREVQANIDQAYILTIEPKGITIEYYRDAKEGLANARLTLAQLHQIYGDVLPCCRIIDWPAYTLRGWMDDQSRGPVPHDAYRQKQWNTLHALKFNFCNYYTEHTLYQKDYPDLAPAYAATKRHPDEVINLQLLAHAEKTLRIPFYQNLMDSRANFNPATEATYDFLFNRIVEAIRQNPNSPYFIINCDETEQLGTGHARHLVDSLGADQVYVDHINRCCELIEQAYYLTHQADLKENDSLQFPLVAMWGDIVAKNPAMMRQLPEDMVYIMWAYEPLDSFDDLVRPFKEQHESTGNRFWVASSSSHSGVMMPTPFRYIKNIANLYRDGLRGGAEGAMITCWDDNGEALFDNCWHALYWAAEMAWNPLKTNDPDELRLREEQFNVNYKHLFYKDIDYDYNPIGTIYRVGALAQNPDIADWYVSSSLLEPLLNINPSIINRDYDKMMDILSQVEKTLDSAASPHAHYALMRMIASSDKLNLQQTISRQLTEGGQDELCQTFTQVYFWHLMHLKHEYLRLWDQENGDYERQIVMDRYDRLGRELLDLDRHVFMEVLPPNNQITQNNPSNQSNQSNQNTQSTPNFPMVKLRTLYNDRPIYYTLDGSEPTMASTLYTEPFPLERSATIKAISYNEYGEGVISEQYLLSHKAMGAKITLNTPYSTYRDIYSGGGTNALIDGQLGSNTTYADGHWQGYWGDSIDAIIELPTQTFKQSRIQTISMRFMQNTFDWILAPTCFKVYGSNDGKNWTPLANKKYKMDPRETGMQLHQYSIELNNQPSTVNYQYFRVIVPNPGPLPSWHPAPGQPSYLFTDEIIVE